MSAIEKMRLAGFEVVLEGDRLKVVGNSNLTTEQRSFLKEHKDDVLKELRQEQEPKPKAILPIAGGVVCCGDCRHSRQIPDSDAVYGWRSCGLGVKDGGGFARADRQCSQFEHGQIQEQKTDLLAVRIAELVADGWAPWNATAKAESEAMQADVGHVATATIVNQSPARIGLTPPTAAWIAAHPAQPAQIPIAGARYSIWRVNFADGRSMTLREPKPSTFDQVVIYCRSLTGFASVEPLGEPMA